MKQGSKEALAIILVFAISHLANDHCREYPADQKVEQEKVEITKDSQDEPKQESPKKAKKIKKVTRKVRMAQWKTIIQKAGSTYGVKECLISAIIVHESDGYCNVVSRAGAKGLMQLMDETANDMGVNDPMDPTQNIMGGTKYIGRLIRHYNGDIQLALAGYNAGPTVVKEYGGVPPYPETKQYIDRVLKSAGINQEKDS